MKPGHNSEGYADPTAAAALEPMEEEEKRVNDLIKALKIVIRLAGFELVDRIAVRSKESRRTYR